MIKKELLDSKAKREIRHRMLRNSIADFSFVSINIMAAVVAAYGLLADSTAIVIGAMLIAMLFGPITGISLGID